MPILEVMLLGVTLTLCSAAPPRPTKVFVDMSYQYDNNTMSFPVSSHPKTTLDLLFKGYYMNQTWLQHYKICSAEHGGTHVDAPSHFREDRWKLHEIPFHRLAMRPAVVINITAKVDLDPEAKVEVTDLLDWENEHGRVPEGSVVFMLSGWGRYWGDDVAYLGSKNKDPTDLKFPGFSEEAAKFLAHRQVAGVGVDTLSLDVGSSITYPAHKVFAEHNIFGVENTANVDKIPPSGAVVSVLPIKITGGTGAPVRIVAEFNQM